MTMAEESQSPGTNPPVADKETLPEIQQLPEEAQSFLKDLPGPQKKAMIALLMAQSWKGPLPPPEVLKGYNEAIPDGAERILKMAENQLELY
jgi:uncharacterized membrane protein